MNRLLSGACVAIALTGSQAFAGPCTRQIAEFEQHLSSRDAGAGPVLGTPSERGPQNQISEAGSSTRSTTEASHMATEVRTGDSGGSNKAGPTSAMSEAAAGTAGSPQDVRLQQQGKPTQAQAAANATPASASGQDKLQRVTADLDRARELDRQNDNACMGAISEARREMNSD
jgi:hypothetical protein